MVTTNTSTSISGPGQLPEELNFRILKQLGLDSIIESGSQQWTDYNEHDPGITILEILTLVATDLSYRSKFPIEDILTIGPAANGGTNYFPDQFYSAAEILSTSPVTLTDFRKVMIDLPGIADAWVTPCDAQGSAIQGLIDITLAPSDALQKGLASYQAMRTELNETETTKLKADLKTLAAVPEGETIPIPRSLVTLLVDLWGLPPRNAADLKIALDAYFHVLPDQLAEITLKLSCFTLPQGIDGGSRDQRMDQLYGLLENLFFSKRLPDDHWLPLGLRAVLENIRSAAELQQSTLAAAEMLYLEHRPLGRDLRKVTLLEPVPILFKLDLQCTPGADQEQTVAQALFTLKQTLSSAVQFLSLEQMMELQANDTNAVFNGPSLQHGFIDDAQLTPRVPFLLASELSNAIRHLPGILHINQLHFAFSTNGRTPDDYEWTDAAVVPASKLPVLGPIQHNHCNLTLSEEQLQYAFDTLIYSEPAAKLSPRSRDLEIPAGQFRDTANYQTIQEDFPRIYELQPYGPSEPEPSRERIAEIRQFQAYLLIFDQILADYFTQLSCAGQLYSWSPDVTSTRFFQGLERVVDQLDDLVDLESYAEQTTAIIEGKPSFVRRRNQFLEMLLKRFGRGLSNELNALYQTPNQRELGVDIRQQFLSQLPALSGRRGTSQNYRSATPSLHLSGLINTINTLCGFDPLTEQNRIFLGLFAQADLKDISMLQAWMPHYTLTNCQSQPIDFNTMLPVALDKKNYRLDRKNLPLSEGEQKQWLGYSLIAKKLKANQDLTSLLESPASPNSILVTLYRGSFIFRVYNDSGQCTLNLSSLQLEHVQSQLKDLEKALEPYWHKDQVAASAKQNIILQVIFLVQQTHRLILAGSLADGTFLEPCQLNQTFADDDSAAPVIESLIQVFTKYDAISRQVTIVEHCLLRPSDQDKQCKVYLQNADSTQWALSDASYSQDALQQIAIGDRETVTWSIHNNSKTAVYQSTCLPPFATQKQDSASTEPDWLRFQVTGPAADTGLYQIQISYGEASHPVALTSTQGFDSPDDAEQAIQSWVSYAVSQRSHQGDAWGITLAGTDSTLSSVPSFLSKDPYSSVATVLLPQWPLPFQDSSYRQTLTELIQAEAPSGIYLNILWVDLPWFQQFLSLHETWLCLYQNPQTTPEWLSAAGSPIIDLILEETARQNHG
ncbi:hypothetical protein [Rubritalea marina]|uniref:hypothetical protein n=1 Tax=Rubritalea marina TaxID=361055 RepID=UPI000376FE6F|nr:hypothetical protein [Rubritalea marina]